MNKLSELAKCYIAAITDGEGTITISRRKGRGKRSINGQIWQYKLVIIITNSHAGLIGFLKDISGVGTTYESKQTFNPHWSTVHRWQIIAKQARDLLTEIRPYLVVKSEIADMVLNMPMQTKGGRKESDKTIYQEQEQYYELAKRLNKRGRKRDINFGNFPSNHPVLLSMLLIQNENHRA